MKNIYWVAIIVGGILTPIAHEIETTRRGYSAIGGEFFIMPLLLIVAVLIDQLAYMVRAIKQMEESR